MGILEEKREKGAEGKSEEIIQKRGQAEDNPGAARSLRRGS